MSKLVTRDALLASLKALRPTALEVPELGGTVYLRPLTLDAMSKLSESKGDKDHQAKVATTVLTACVCDESGVRLLTQEDSEAIMQTSAGAVTRIVEAAMAASTAKSVKEAAGN